MFTHLFNVHVGRSPKITIKHKNMVHANESLVQFGYQEEKRKGNKEVLLLQGVSQIVILATYDIVWTAGPTPPLKFFDNNVYHWKIMNYFSALYPA